MFDCCDVEEFTPLVQERRSLQEHQPHPKDREDLVVDVTRQKVDGLVESPSAATFATSVNPSTENHLMSLTCVI